MKKLFAITLLLFFIQPASACLILILGSKNQILVGNHEDWYATDAQVIIVPATAHTYGFAGFGFASEAFIQGGMNTEGLFFDATATPFVPVDFSDKPSFDGYIWQAVLEQCATVHEAVTLIKKYKIPDLQRIHVAFADKSGTSVVIGAYEGSLKFHYRNNHSYQVLTNFNLTDPFYGNEPVCNRFETATHMLQQDSSITISNVQHILAQTHQPALTVYSTIYDLTNGDIYIYNKANFNNSVKLNLTQALQKGGYRKLLDNLF